MPGVGLLVGLPSHRGIDPVRAGGGVLVHLEVDERPPALGGVAQRGPQQGLRDPVPAGAAVHPEVFQIRALAAGRGGLDRGGDEAARGQPPALPLDLRDPPVVPVRLVRSLDQSLDELGEGLTVGPPVVGERLLEHPVHGADVLGDRQAELVTVHAPDPGALARGGQRGRLLGGDGAAHVQPGADHLVACRLEQLGTVGVQRVRVGGELGGLHAPGAGEGAAHLDRPVQQRGGKLFQLGGVGGDDELDVRAPARAVLERDPRQRRQLEGGGAVDAGGHDDDLPPGPRLQPHHPRAQSCLVDRGLGVVATHRSREQRGHGGHVRGERQARGESALEGGGQRGCEVIDEQHPPIFSRGDGRGPGIGALMPEGPPLRPAAAPVSPRRAGSRPPACRSGNAESTDPPGPGGESVLSAGCRDASSRGAATAWVSGRWAPHRPARRRRDRPCGSRR